MQTLPRAATPIQRAPARLDQIGRVQVVLRMPGVEQTVVAHMADQPRQDAALGRLVEIDHHVAAEQRRVRAADIVTRCQQVQLAVFDELAQRRDDPALALVGAAAALEVLALDRCIQRGDAVDGVDAARGGFQHLGVDVGGDDADRRGQGAEGFAGGDGDGVGLLTGGGRAGPDLQRRLRGALLQFFAQLVEVVRLAEERGQIGGQRVGERLPFLLVVACFHLVQVVAEGAQAEHAKTTRQPAIHHVALGRSQGDADTLIDQVADALEIAVAKIKFACV
ncbi:hypothetical protein XPU_0546 [Xanthomonas arboricola pv. pruni str. MAFF 311562]|uniref:Uncharacterized protein n=1 Tax=Xanthomonas arboricola pv. pruni str. MAFF 311562 TaxID=1414836 RepID=W4RZD3_9XANT|nr:hypothetical protein XPU_0546 [Xanthomonas arboricola pv. pruni str. MAFF 311562]